jgi:exosortase D (VPLPA-CTERM-specific)
VQTGMSMEVVSSVSGAAPRPGFRTPVSIWAALAVAAVAGWFAFAEGAKYMLLVWGSREEYSHAYLIPLISLFIAWQRKNELARIEFTGSWLGVAVVVLGIVLGLIGQLGSVFTLQQIGLVTAVVGVVIALTGLAALRILWMPLLLLYFVIPLPNFLQVKFSAGMQLISSAIGVWFLRLIGVSVYLEGNVIDLGVYQLQVAEACDGLRYLYPLLTLGLVLAYFYKGAMWKRVAIFLSSIPITILMNSLRIASIGVMVDNWGIGMAEGFLHDFQGWAVFMVSFGLMVLLMIGLSRVGSDRRPWRELFGLEFPEPWPAGVPRTARSLPGSLSVSSALLVAAAAVAFILPQRAEIVPARLAFLDFPMVIGQGCGSRDALEPIYVQSLQFDDYVLADFKGPAPRPINLYVAWYDSQRAGKSVHSPSTCLPGGGWKMTSFSQVEVPGVSVAGQPLRVNRTVIALGDARQLVYYWFQQRGRVLTNEYLVKWYLFWDSLTRNRSDGSLVRLIVPLPEGATEEQADRQLAQFAAELEPVLQQYVPR